MVINILCIATFFGTVVIVGLIHYVYKWKNPKCSDGGKLPPGSMGLPLIGETLEFFIPMVVSLDPEFNHFIFQQERKTVQLWYMDSFSAIFGDAFHASTDVQVLKYFRNSLLNQFGIETIKENLLPKLEVMANKYVESWSKQPEIELKASLTSMIFDFTAEHLFHYDAKTSAEENLSFMFADFFKSIMTFPLNIPGTTYHRCMKNQKKAIKLMKDILRERRNSAEKKGDFLDQVIEDMSTMEFLTEDFVVYFIFATIIGSFASISSTLTLASMLLTDHPAVVEELLQEQEEVVKSREKHDSPLTWKEYKSMTFMSQVCVITETLRMSNLDPGMPRKVIKDIHINGYVIPKGWTILLVSSAVHMNPEKFSNPLDFDPWRWNNVGTKAPTRDYMPFGGGIRHCVGAEFSKVLMAVFIRSLITRFSDLGEFLYQYVEKYSNLIINCNSKHAVGQKTKGGNPYRSPALSFGDGFHIKIFPKDQMKTACT
ncbi:hypothetical protein MKW92_038721 [Papaver armeniacum]|nr:hypothetical protein MKW92_038721 [Papaver armeniacum]